MLYFRFDQDKALAALLFIADRLIQRRGAEGADIHRICKILYFADQRHLANYGRPIVGDHYVAMEHGPVPSRIYDMIKMVRGDSFFQDTIGLNQFFDVTEHYVAPKKKANLDEFSESDLECFEESVKENQDLTFNELKKKSHDSAYKQAQEDDKVPFIEMAKVGGAEESTVHFIRLQSENDQALLYDPLFG